jgi:hypothetical protein
MFKIEIKNLNPRVDNTLRTVNVSLDNYYSYFYLCLFFLFFVDFFLYGWSFCSFISYLFIGFTLYFHNHYIYVIE